MKRFALFQFESYYPSGGWGDFVQAFDTPEDAIIDAQTRIQGMPNWHVIDLQTGTEVA